jgi:hypothetical protein
MLVLYESSLGYCLFRLKDGGNLLAKSGSEQRAALAGSSSESSSSNLLKLQSVHRFSDTAAAVEEISAVGEGKISKNLKKFLVEQVQGGKAAKKGKEEQLVVSDPKLVSASFRRSISSRFSALNTHICTRTYTGWSHRQKAEHVGHLGQHDSRSLPRYP